MIGFILFAIALILIFILGTINYWYVENKKGYFKTTARNLDIFACGEFKALWNTILIKSDGYKFGVSGETMSSVLGKNQKYNKLKSKGWWVVKQLDKIEKNHCLISIDWSFGK